jgi:hypothetical protein
MSTKPTPSERAARRARRNAQSPDIVRTVVRRARRRASFPADARCGWCGIANPDVLKRARRSLFERHHVAGHANDPGWTVILCLNCHRLATIAQGDAGAPLSAPESEQARAIAALVGLASFSRESAERLLEIAHVLAGPTAALPVAVLHAADQGSEP